MPRVVRLFLFAVALLALPAHAVKEIEGVRFEDKTKVGAAELTLNGAGLRTRAFFKVYAMGLYLAEQKNATEAVLGLKGAKRIEIVTLRDLTAQQFADALVEGMHKNNGEAEMAALKPSVDEFRATLLALKEAPRGTVIQIDYVPESGTQLNAGGQAKGKPIAGEEFSRALLKVWLGDKPVQQDLKEALLGKGQ